MIDWCWECRDDLMPMSPVNGCSNVDCVTHVWAAVIVEATKRLRVLLGMPREPSPEELDALFQEEQELIEVRLEQEEAKPKPKKSRRKP
jgi:hypothetical protein